MNKELYHYKLLSANDSQKRNIANLTMKNLQKHCRKHSADDSQKRNIAKAAAAATESSPVSTPAPAPAPAATTKPAESWTIEW